MSRGTAASPSVVVRGGYVYGSSVTFEPSHPLLVPVQREGKGSLVAGYAWRSGRDPEDIAALMAAETWFDARYALDAGLATRIAEPVRIAASFDIARFRNAPPELVEAVTETVAASNGFDAQDTAPDAEGAGPDQRNAEPDPESLAEDKTFDPAQAGVPGGNTHPVPSDPGGTCAGASTSPEAATIRAEAMAHARAVIDLCRLAGQPQMAGRFLEEEASLETVRARLIEARAEVTPEITPHHPQPGRSTTARPWGDVIARTFKLKG